MPKPLKLMLLVTAFLFGLIATGFCEDITITTYYPAPYGSYNELQLYPHSPPVTTCDDNHKGVMYFDSTDNEIKVCRGSLANWDASDYWVMEDDGVSLHPQELNWNVGIGISPDPFNSKLVVSAARGQNFGIRVDAYGTGIVSNSVGRAIHGIGEVDDGVRGESSDAMSSGAAGVHGINTSSGPGGRFESTSGPALITGNGNVGIGVNPVNRLDIAGNVAIGSGYAGTAVAPVDGLW